MSTQILDPNSPEYAAALQELLAGFAHGDPSRVAQVFKALGRDIESTQLGHHAHQLVTSFHSTVWNLRGDFDPTAVTMSSTNIPDAARKLETVLEDTAKATHSLLALINQQEEILKQQEVALQALEKASSAGTVSHKELCSFITHHRDLNRNLLSLATEMVTTQEHQDLCGQRVQKVLRLIKALELSLTDLLGQMKIALPTQPSTPPDGQENVDQSSADDILKGFGI